MLPKFIAFFTMFLFMSAANAQNARGNISGQVQEKGVPLIGVNVVLMRQNDSLTQVAGVSTDEKGRFKFEQLKADTYALRLTYLGYESVKIRNIRLAADASFPLDTVKMRLSDNDLSDVIVEASIIKVQLIGDTIQYNAAAFKTNPDAMVEDLIKKMPGITVENGIVKAQGQVVSKITIDGQDFFGDDVATAIKNIPANQVDKIQFFNAQSDKAALTGIKDATPQKGMNIVTKSGSLKGVFGNFDAAYGTKNRYNIGGNFNKFSANRRISIVGSADNINKQGFSFQDKTISDGENESTSLWGDNAFTHDFGAGINASQVLGINYNESFGKKVTLSASYSAGFIQNKNTATLRRQYLPRTNSTPDAMAIQRYDEQTTSRQKQLHHRFTSKLKYTIDSLTTLEIEPNFSWQGGQQIGNFAGINTIDSLPSNSSKTLNNSSNVNYEGDINATFSRKLNKPRRSIMVYIYGDVKNNQLNRLLISENIFANALANQPNNNLKINQLSRNKNKGNNISGWLEYTEPLSKKVALTVSNLSDKYFNGNDNRTHNFTPNNTYSGLDTLLSNTFDNQPLENTASISYHFDNSLGKNSLSNAPQDSTHKPPKDFNFHIGLSYKNSQLNGAQSYPNSFQIKRSYNNLLPNINFTYNFSPMAMMQLYYSVSNELPKIQQLQNLINNQNPLFLSSGNSALKQSLVQRLYFIYMNFNTKNNSSFSVFINSSTSNNYIGNSIFIANNDTIINNNLLLRKGAQFAQAANLGRAWSSDGGIFKSFSLPKLKLEANLNLTFDFNSLPALINGQTSRTNNGNAHFQLFLHSNISEKFGFSFIFMAAHNLFHNSLTKQISSSSSQSSSFNTNYYFAKRLVASLSVQQNAVFGMSSGFNRNFITLSGGLGCTMLKDNRAKLSLSVRDALAQNSDINRKMFDIYYEDRSTTVLRRYILLNFSYRLNSSASKDKIQLIGG